MKFFLLFIFIYLSNPWWPRLRPLVAKIPLYKYNLPRQQRRGGIGRNSSVKSGFSQHYFYGTINLQNNQKNTQAAANSPTKKNLQTLFITQHQNQFPITAQSTLQHRDTFTTRHKFTGTEIKENKHGYKPHHTDCTNRLKPQTTLSAESFEERTRTETQRKIKVYSDSLNSRSKGVGYFFRNFEFENRIRRLKYIDKEQKLKKKTVEAAAPPLTTANRRVGAQLRPLLVGEEEAMGRRENRA